MNRQDFKCKCGCNKRIVVDHWLFNLLIFLELIYGPATIISGNRCEVNNKNAGGIKNSLHLIGLAVDIKFDLDTPYKWMQSIKRYSGLVGVRFDTVNYFYDRIHIELDEK